MNGHAPKVPHSLVARQPELTPALVPYLGFVYTYRQSHRFSDHFKMGSMQSYGAVYT